MGLILRTGKMAVSTVWTTLRRGVRLRPFLDQLSEQGVGSVVFIFITLSFVGVLGVFQLAKQMERLIPEYSLLGAGFIQLMIREMSPIMAALMVATKVGTGLAAEVGTMRVTDQIDAMKLCGADPMEEIVVPRVWAGVVATTCLSILGAVVSVFAGVFIAWVGFDVSADTFLSMRFMRHQDVAVGLVKAAIFGFAVPIVSLSCGFAAKGGSDAVGEATTKAVVYSSFTVILLDLILGAVAELMLR
jgi:phospholipid/cholesterol/gamma-HCH transport system permease protein